MEIENNTVETQQVEVQKSPLNCVTPLSKYLAMALFIAMPFIGGWIGYTYAPEKVVEVERVVVERVVEEAKDAVTPMTSPVVQKINWNIEKSNAIVTEGYEFKRDEQAISIDVTFEDNSIKRYDLGTAYGCTGTTSQAVEGDKTVLGKVECYYALTGVGFKAYLKNGKFIVERGDESARDGSVQKTLLLEI